ncbi:hypothetical protein CAP35_02570 [Chitinophagaceae bacterium IBVUCB1]|nr:hypothetical protein CAP35_02570 [Chitinophagaceae bacterium IBVUCB1]
MQHQPLVSVLMTAYNRGAYIGSAIESVLANTYTNFELIIVDDCSTDNTLEVANQFAEKDTRIKIYKNDTNLGDYPNRNKAASYAQGKYLKYCDSDEELYPFCLEMMVGSMEENPNGALGLSHIHDVRRLPYMVSSEEAYKWHYFKKDFFHNAPTSTIIRRAEFEKEGGFNNIRHRGDYDLWLRLSAKYAVVRVPAFLTWNFDHDGQEKSKNYLYKKALTHNISIGALKDSNCPLSNEDRQKALHLWRRGFIRQNIFGGLLKLKFKEVLYLMKECKITLAEVINAVK